ncbi:MULTISPECIES: VWA domain-containing protein [unclassified Pseudarthrobacter]|uniref:vWA domain-containing protein n=1 Tax=unclassified Pseudarthrobacter TaxID=2647000 RepID=UPI003638021D
MELMFWWLLPGAALAAGAAAWIAVRHRQADVRRRPAAHSDRLTMLPEYQDALRRHRRWLAVAGLACAALLTSAAVAAARPVQLTTTVPEQRNRDIMLCLDVSGSMSSADAAVVEVFAELAREFDGERIGLTVFDSSGSQVFPLTDDYGYARDQLLLARDAFDGKPGSSGFLDGTWGGRGSSLIGDGLASCLSGFPRTQDSDAGADGTAAKRSRSVVLATDNYVSGNPILTLSQAASLAKDRTVRVYALNPGDLDYGPDAGQPGAQLRKAAESTGGSYYALDNPGAVPGIVAAVQETEATTLKGAPRAVVSDQPALPLGVAVLSGITLGAALWRMRL